MEMEIDMKRILGGTALALLMAAPVAAQTTDAGSGAAGIYLPSLEGGIRASRFIGKRVYVSETDIGTDAMNDASADWLDVGEISDVIMGQTGAVDVVLVDVGGFLGIGEKSVAVNLADIRTVADGDTPDNYFLVFKGSQAELEGAPAFNDMAAMPAAAEGDATTTAPAEDTAAATDPAVTADPAATDDTAAVADPAGGMMPADMAMLTSEKLTGASVRGSADEAIGEVSDVVLEGDTVTGVVVDVGGFLGMGEKPVVLAPDMIEVWQDADGSIYEVKVKATKEELEALPAYNAG